MSLIMKRLSLAVSVLLICLGAGAQNISLSFSGASLSDVLHAMEEQTDCSFIYETADLNKASSITRRTGLWSLYLMKSSRLL